MLRDTLIKEIAVVAIIGGDVAECETLRKYMNKMATLISLGETR